MRSAILALIAVLLLGLAACTSSQNDNDTNSPARQVGKGAYRATQETKKAARKAGQELDKAAREAREGWNEATRESEQKKKE